MSHLILSHSFLNLLFPQLSLLLSWCAGIAFLLHSLFQFSGDAFLVAEMSGESLRLHNISPSILALRTIQHEMLSVDLQTSQVSLDVRQVSTDQWPRWPLFFLWVRAVTPEGPWWYFFLSMLFSSLFSWTSFLLFHGCFQQKFLCPCVLSCQNEILSYCHLRMWCHEESTDFQPVLSWKEKRPG